ncbi:hypothetical protein [Pedobacter endophyticus]|uniref:DUF3575 domain-containing protein n=1 Tax=Pedobacter endophyticus TaxID=2789740 RepID=A0A7S9PZL1_9SPHI|nr:hypothetical protein [Pedobacter endophyticus]QPH39816.1 hypothetical protein IZT61_00590 [Pedobacter endophyticus]
MRKHLLTISLFIAFYSAVAQTKKNSIYLEGLGNAVVYSVNYDRIFSISDYLKVAPRVGVEYIPRRNLNKYGKFTFPAEINLLYNQNRSNSNFIEGGLGLTLFSLFDDYEYEVDGNIRDKNYKLGIITMLRLGYRHQKPSGGLMYRAGLLVRLSQDDFSKSKVGDDLFYRIWPGFSIGYTF